MVHYIVNSFRNIAGATFLFVFLSKWNQMHYEIIVLFSSSVNPPPNLWNRTSVYYKKNETWYDFQWFNSPDSWVQTAWRYVTKLYRLDSYNKPKLKLLKAMVHVGNTMGKYYLRNSFWFCWWIVSYLYHVLSWRFYFCCLNLWSRCFLF